MSLADPSEAAAGPRVRCREEGLLEDLSAGLISKIVERAWTLYSGPPGAVGEVAFLGEEEHTARHAEFFEDPSPTDVMAFPYGDKDLFGEILVNRDMCLVEGEKRRISPRSEACLYVAHGALHLLGFRDDEDDERERMRAAERSVLEGI